MHAGGGADSLLAPRGMNSVNEVEQEVERLAAVIVPYICERTGLSKADVARVLDVQEEFWNNQHHVVGRMFILGFEVEDEDAGQA